MRQAHTMISYGGVISFNLYINVGEGRGGVFSHFIVDINFYINIISNMKKKTEAYDKYNICIISPLISNIDVFRVNLNFKLYFQAFF